MSSRKLKKLELKAIKSKIITSDDSLIKILQKVLKRYLKENDIIVVSSKVVAVTQGRIREIASPKEFEALVQHEADKVLGGEIATLTLKNGILIPWAGIDRSNIKAGQVVLWPEKPFEAAAQIQKELKKHFSLKNMGVIIADSTCAPLRRGVHSIALGYAGFRGVNDLRGKKDLYGNTLKVTQQAIADNLATAACLLMGESNESTPFVIVRGANVTFTNKNININEAHMEPKDCLFKPLFTNLWQV